LERAKASQKGKGVCYQKRGFFESISKRKMHQKFPLVRQCIFASLHPLLRHRSCENEVVPCFAFPFSCSFSGKSHAVLLCTSHSRLFGATDFDITDLSIVRVTVQSGLACLSCKRPFGCMFSWFSLAFADNILQTELSIEIRQALEQRHRDVLWALRDAHRQHDHPVSAASSPLTNGC
jgi:hypothetical protein